MKKILLSAVLMSAFAASAAITTTVESANTAVVAPVTAPQTAGYQLVCVPVSGFDITGEDVPAQLDALLPVAERSEGDEAQVWISSAAPAVTYHVYTVEGGAWKAVAVGDEGSGSTATGPGEFAAGAIIWLKTAHAVGAMYGQEFGGAITQPAMNRGTRANPGYNLIGNPDPAEALDLDEVTGAVPHEAYRTSSDRVMLLKGGSAYETWHKKSASEWWNPATSQVVPSLALAPGQAAWFVSLNGNN